MRIVGGTKRGVRLASLPGTTTRPTADRVKEALFNIVAARVPGASVLDLFAGSGAIGLEALSRGARSATFVEYDRRAVRIIRDNVSRTTFEEQIRVITGDVFSALKERRVKGCFDLIFADPPYGRQLASRTLVAVADAQLLSSDGLFVVEHDKREELPTHRANMEQIRTARYGNTMLSFYVHPAAKESPRVTP